jgi:hypothetical protein
VTLLGKLTVAFLAESAALALLWLGMGAALAVLGAALAGRPPLRFRPLLPAVLSGAAGAMVAGSLAARIGIPAPLVLQIGRREVPIVWSLAGAAVGVAAYLLAARTRAAA